MGTAIRAALLAIVFLAGALRTAPAHDWGILYTELDYTSDYRFYGLSESNRQPTVQGVLHWIAPDDFYAGVFASGVRFNDFRHTSYELDFYGGRHFKWAGDDLNLEVLYGAYPNASSTASYAPGVRFPTYNFFETTAELTHSFGAFSLAGKALFEPRSGSRKVATWGADLTGSYTVADWLTASANYGDQWDGDDHDKSHWNVGATALQVWEGGARRVSLDLRYFGTDITRAHCFHTNWCQGAFVVKVGYGIAL